MHGHKLHVHFTTDLLEKLNEAAKDSCMNWSDYIRQAVIFKMKHDKAEARAEEKYLELE